VVDGHVKSGKTTTARYIVPWCANKVDYFQAARVVYLDLSSLADAQGRNLKEHLLCEMVVSELQLHRVHLGDCHNIASLRDRLRLLKQVPNFLLALTTALISSFSELS
jgi:hypothetical protein